MRADAQLQGPPVQRLAEPLVTAAPDPQPAPKPAAVRGPPTAQGSAPPAPAHRATGGCQRRRRFPPRSAPQSHRHPAPQRPCGRRPASGPCRCPAERGGGRLSVRSMHSSAARRSANRRLRDEEGGPACLHMVVLAGRQRGPRGQPRHLLIKANNSSSQPPPQRPSNQSAPPPARPAPPRPAAPHQPRQTAPPPRPAVHRYISRSNQQPVKMSVQS